MKCNLCMVTFRLRLLNIESELKTLMMISESPNICMLLCPDAFASWHAFISAYNSAWSFVSCHTPHLKLVSNFLLGEKINPPAPTFLEFPFDAPSKKIETLFFICHHSENSFSESLTYQSGLVIGLLNPIWILSTCFEPSHLYSASNLVPSI